MNVGENRCLTQSHWQIIDMPKEGIEERQQAVNSNALDNLAFGTGQPKLSVITF